MKQNRILSWESHLIQRAADGDLVAFELLEDLYRPSLMQVAWKVLRNQEDAHDAVQDTMVKAFRSLPDFDPNRPIKPWLCRICTNCAVDMLRHRQKGADSIDDVEYYLADDRVDIEQSTSDAADWQTVRAAIDRLPAQYRDIVMMRHVDDLDVDEIAERLDKPSGTIKSWLFRARALLRKELQPVYSSI